ILSRACRSSLSTTRESSLFFSFFSCSSVFASPDKNAICFPSGAHSKAPMLLLLFVKAAASPPFARITKICCSLSSRLERKASCVPSGDQRGQVSDFSEYVNCHDALLLKSYIQMCRVRCCPESGSLATNATRI